MRVLERRIADEKVGPFPPGTVFIRTPKVLWVAHRASAVEWAQFRHRRSELRPLPPPGSDAPSPPSLDLIT